MINTRKIRSGFWYLVSEVIGWTGNACDMLASECALWSYRAAQKAFKLDPTIVDRGVNNGSRW
jgi:hypothetical protein